jgi:ACS family pantothenate transporter-like MFS transporter
MICGALEAFCVQGLYLLWLKYEKLHFTQAQITTYPLGIQAVGIVSNIMAALYIDATGRRVPMGLLACGLQLISAIILIVPGVGFAATMFAFYCAGTSYIVNPLLFGWANIILQRGGDDALRSVILAAMNSASQILYVFWGIILYPSSDAPYWQKGAIGMIVVIVCLVSLLGVVQWVS